MKHVLLILCFGLLLSCRKDDSLPGIEKIGHSGMGIYGDYPMNSFESLMQALYLGADGVEMDIQMTRDSVLILFHDEELSNQTNGNGLLHDHSWDEIKALSYDAVALGRYDIIRLDFFLENCGPYRDKLFYFDIKPNAPNQRHLYALNKKLSALITRFDLENNAILMYQNNSQLVHMLSLRRDLKIYSYSDFETAKTNIITYNLAGWVASRNDINASNVSQMHEIGASVVAFSTFNKNDHVDLIHSGVDAIQTDNLKNLLNLYK